MCSTTERRGPLAGARVARSPFLRSRFDAGSRGSLAVLAECVLARVAPVAGIGIVHELADGIELAAHCLCEWTGTAENEPPIVIRHEVGDARPTGMTPVLEVPPWCTFHLDGDGEPASLFHAVFGEVDRLLVCEEP